MDMLLNYSFAEAEQAIMLLHDYNLKSIGIRNYGTSGASLMKELAYKIIKEVPILCYVNREMAFRLFRSTLEKKSSGIHIKKYATH